VEKSRNLGEENISEMIDVDAMGAFPSETIPRWGRKENFSKWKKELNI